MFDRLLTTAYDRLQRLKAGWRATFAWGEEARRWILIAAAGLIIAGFVLTVRAYPEILQNLSWAGVAALVAMATPVLLVIGGLELKAMANCLGVEIGLGRAVYVSVVGTAVNVLPLPGAMVTRIAALNHAGASGRQATQLMVLHGVLWLGLTMVLGGAAMVATGFAITGAGTTAAGLGVAGATAALIARMGAPGRPLVRLVLLRTLGVFVDGIRAAVALATIGFAIPFFQAMIFTLASSFGSALSIIPAGLGGRELVTTALAPMVGIPLAVGFAAAVVIRLADLATVFFVVISFLTTRKWSFRSR